MKKGKKSKVFPKVLVCSKNISIVQIWNIVCVRILSMCMNLSVCVWLCVSLPSTKRKETDERVDYTRNKKLV